MRIFMLTAITKENEPKVQQFYFIVRKVRLNRLYWIFNMSNNTSPIALEIIIQLTAMLRMEALNCGLFCCLWLFNPVCHEATQHAPRPRVILTRSYKSAVIANHRP